MALSFLDLFAGAGGLSEGFLRAGFKPIAHVEMNSAACFTLKTRTAYHYLAQRNDLQSYIDYLYGRINRETLYQKVPGQILDAVINRKIASDTMAGIIEDINELAEGKKVDLIIGGPPCQAYSLIGRARDKLGMKSDERNYLYSYYAEFLEIFKPHYFVFENVEGLLSAKDYEGHLFFDTMHKSFSEAGYSMEYRILNAGDYGIPQDRRRLILVGKRGKYSDFFPEPASWNPHVLVKNILEDLPFLSAGGGSIRPCKLSKEYHPYLKETEIRNNNIPVTFHKARPNTLQDLEIYRLAVEYWNNIQQRLNYNQLPEKLKTHKNRKSFTDRFKVVAGNLPRCHTIVAHAAHDGHYYIHPDIAQNRSLTPREMARLQTFPDDYFFESCSGKPALFPAYQQIGNAVPVTFAQRIAEKIKENW